MTALLALLILVQDDKPVLPSAIGTSWTFRDTVGGKAKDVVMTVAPLEDPKIERVELTPEGSKRGKFEKAVLVQGEGVDSWAIESSDGEIRIFHELVKGHFGIHWVLKTDMKDGSTWTGHRIYLSCGFGDAEETYKAVAEKVTVPAGTFDAIRIDATEKNVSTRSLWIVRGVGIVKISEEGRVCELVKAGK